MAAETSSPAHLAPGTALGDRFVVEGLLGEGAMGTVYRAKDRLADRPAAVKVLKRQLLQSREFVTRFKREARAAARFRHESAVRVLATGETEDRLPFIAMELVEGRPLDEIVAKEAPLAAGRACNLAHQLLRALGAAHRQGIVHRDVKPSNIRVVRDADGIERPKILDFGVVKFLRQDGADVTGGVKTRTGVILGTPKYMAPEQIRGEAVDGRADVYAVGAMLHEMLTGKPPFEAEDVFGFVAMHLKQDVVPVTQRFPDLEVPHAVDEILLRMLAKDPKERPEDATHLADELERFAVEDPGAGQKTVALRRGILASVAGGVAGAAAAWVLAPDPAPAASAAALGLGLGAAVAARRFGRPSVFSYVRRVATVAGACGLLGAASLAVPGSPGVVVTGSLVLAALVVYTGFLLVWNRRPVALRVLAAGVIAPALCAALFPVRVASASRDAYFVAVHQSSDGASSGREDDAKTGALLALAAISVPFAVASVFLPRPGAARLV